MPEGIGYPGQTNFPSNLHQTIGEISSYLPQIFRRPDMRRPNFFPKFAEAMRTPVSGLRYWNAGTGAPVMRDPAQPGLTGLNQSFMRAFRTPIPGYSQYAGGASIGGVPQGFATNPLLGGGPALQSISAIPRAPMGAMGSEGSVMFGTGAYGNLGRALRGYGPETGPQAPSAHAMGDVASALSDMGGGLGGLGSYARQLGGFGGF